jgi:cytochrome c-type biogenesis protein CcsB
MNKQKVFFLFSPWFTGVLFIVFAMAMAFATFFEKDFGAEAARLIIYDARWFETIFLLLVINFLGQLIVFKLYRKRKLAILLFHLAFILIIIGAALTRYFGFEGFIHIREGKIQNMCKTSEKYLNLTIINNQGDVVLSDHQEFVATLIKKQKYKKTFAINQKEYSIRYSQFLPNASETIVNDPNGKPMVSLMVSNGMQRENIILSKGESKNVNGLKIGFLTDDYIDILIAIENESFVMRSKTGMQTINMENKQHEVIKADEEIRFERMKIYQIDDWSIVPNSLTMSGVLQVVSLNYKTHQTNKNALVFEISGNGQKENVYLWQNQNGESITQLDINNHTIKLSYAPLKVELPFSLRLNDFILERYPGSTSPSSYKSKVELIDSANQINKPYSIYMNHILKYKGWRFYQSSYDPDEKGTILSVNKDLAGILVTYTGYFLLFLFIIFSLLNKNSHFRTVNKRFFKSNGLKIILLISIFQSSIAISNAQNSKNQKFLIHKDQANQFGKILVQDQKGRTEPLYTLSSDILRKISRDTKLGSYSPMQVFLGIYFDFENWQHEPIIRISNNDIKKLIGIKHDYAAFSDIVSLRSNTYKLKHHVQLAYEKPPNARNKFDKEIIKVDERINICFMIYTGEFMKIFPVQDSSLKWRTPHDAYAFGSNSEDSIFLKGILSVYVEEVQNANNKGDFQAASEIVNSIINYQRKYAQYNLPSSQKVNAEILYYKSGIYDKLFPYYAGIGILLLIILIYGIIRQNKNLFFTISIFKYLLILGFTFHTAGLAVRWYISGHAPMSNGYESMIFISWVTILAGFIFNKRSAFVLAATSVLGGFTLMVAHLSFMDPEITNLVPVLQSYWLTLHVSIITGSYGFLGLGAILGIIVLVLYSFSTKSNAENISTTIQDLSIINYKTVTIGLYLLTIGTFLGAIWANESWGRYWGWDPKETWSLITIIVYSFVIHSRMIDGLKGYYSFNVLSLFAFSSVLMTYFGVNYYLSGLHSYAGGDPVPVPVFVFASVIILLLVAVFAYWKYSKRFMNNAR